MPPRIVNDGIRFRGQLHASAVLTPNNPCHPMDTRVDGAPEPI